MKPSLQRRSSARGGRRPLPCDAARVEALAREPLTQAAIAASLGMALSTFTQKLKSSPELRRAYERGRAVYAERAARLRADAARRARPWGRIEDGSIEAGLYLLSLITPRGVTLTQAQIADACGCSRGLIYLIEREALRKLKAALGRRGFREAA